MLCLAMASIGKVSSRLVQAAGTQECNCPGFIHLGVGGASKLGLCMNTGKGT